MGFKLNISDKGKAWKLQLESDSLAGKKLGDKVHGKDLSPDMQDYELEITGASDTSGFPQKKDIEGPGLRKVLLKKGWGMHESHEGLRKRKTVRGAEISEKTSQINLIVKKHGHKKFEEIFPDQNKPKEKPVKQTQETAPTQAA